MAMNLGSLSAEQKNRLFNGLVQQEKEFFRKQMWSHEISLVKAIEYFFEAELNINMLSNRHTAETAAQEFLNFLRTRDVAVARAKEIFELENKLQELTGE